jgi:repressor LexA
MEFKLTKQQRAVYRVVDNYESTGKPSPSLRQIGEALGLRNVNAVFKHVTALRRKGLISEAQEGRTGVRLLSALKPHQNRVVHIPVFGSIPAGLADRREQEAEGCVSVDVASIGYKPARNAFALRVKGDSMIGRHILDGDFVIMEHGPEPRNGQIVAALIDGESTLKTFILKAGKPYLKAENPNYPNLIPAQELMIQGVFKALIRRSRE